MSQNTPQGGQAPAQPYAERADLVADMSDPRYTGGPGTLPDPDFVAHVESRLAAPPARPTIPQKLQFHSAGDVVAAMRDARYETDELYTAAVREGLKDVDLGTRQQYSQTIMYDGKGGFFDVEETRYARLAEQNAAALDAIRPVNVPGVGTVTPYRNSDELVADMSTPEYQRGEAPAHAIVSARLAVSNIL